MFKTLARELRGWREWLKVLGLLLLIIGFGALIVMFWVVLLALVGLMFGVFALAWAFGMKITIKKKDVKVGYLRWFTFHTY